MSDPRISLCPWLFSFQRQHKPAQIMGETVLLGRWTEKERRSLYIDWMARNSLSADNPEHKKLLNMRIVHCFLFRTPNERLLTVTPSDDLTLVQRTVASGDDERIGLVVDAIHDWMQEIEAQKKALMPSSGESPNDSALNSGAPAQTTSGQS